jgi:hypothetical protein
MLHYPGVLRLGARVAPSILFQPSARLSKSQLWLLLNLADAYAVF